MTQNWGSGPGQVNGALNATPDALLHVQPGEEIVTDGAASLTLNTQSSTISVPAGSGITFPTGVPGGDVVEFSAAGTVTSAGGAVTSFNANSPITVAAGSTVALDGTGTMTFASGSAPVPVTIAGTGTINTGNGASASLTVTNSNTGISLSPGNSSIALPANTVITLTGGLTGNGHSHGHKIHERYDHCVWRCGVGRCGRQTVRSHLASTARCTVLKSNSRRKSTVVCT